MTLSEFYEISAFNRIHVYSTYEFEEPTLIGTADAKDSIPALFNDFEIETVEGVSQSDVNVYLATPPMADIATWLDHVSKPESGIKTVRIIDSYLFEPVTDFNPSTYVNGFAMDGDTLVLVINE